MGKKSRIRVTIGCEVDGERVEVGRVYTPEVLDEATADAIIEDIFKFLEEELEVSEKESEGK